MFFITDAHAAAGAAGGMEDILMQMLPMVLIFVAFWFFLIRPQQKRQKEHIKMVEALTKGDEVLTAGGLSGRVESVEDQYMNVQIASVDDKPVVIRMQRMAVQMVLPKGTLKF